MTTDMQKWEIAAPGDANLRMVTTFKPVPKPGEILIEVDAVSLNYRERWIIDGGMGSAWETPLTPGSDVAGRVVAVGEHVTRFAVGDRVIDNDGVRVLREIFLAQIPPDTGDGPGVADHRSGQGGR